MYSDKKPYILIMLIIAAGLLATLAYQSIPSGALEVNFFNVGQGDAIFIETPNKRQVLVDGGPDNTILQKLEKELPFYDRHIDLLVATHLDADHIAGLIGVLKRFDVDAVLISDTECQTNVACEFFEVAKNSNSSIVKVKRGDVFVLDKDIKFHILSPQEKFSYTDKNDRSIVAKLVYKDDCFLLTGDIEKRAEYNLAQNINLQCEVLKVAHHGSNTSSTQYFLNKVGAKIAIIQSDPQKYGHPHKDVLKRLQGMQILRNDQNGDIIIHSYGNSI